MLTTNPAARMGVSDSKGTVTAGKLADLTILDADPADGPDELLPRARRRAIRQSRLAALDHRQLCPIHRSFIAMSGFGPMTYTDDCASAGFRPAGSPVFLRICL